MASDILGSLRTGRNDRMAILKVTYVTDIVVEEGEKAHVDCSVLGIRKLSIIRTKGVSLRFRDEQLRVTIRYYL